MLFSNELNYWVIKKNAKKYLLLRMGRHIRTCLKRNSGISLPKGRSMGTGSCSLIFMIKYSRVLGCAVNLVGADHRQFLYERDHPSLSYQSCQYRVPGD
ncbi:hypothetical protein [Leptospira borgpetersenii]|uniref:hypothetical protein n=1 Tax=Leptospira borgpetersenii TaxID=174 RepID=UPI002152BC74|nr:hypothetical protein [Leptospira borgpetersenii]UVA65292.1 hypothetical protein LH336_06545 [Leptospira borgpetersenii]